MPWTFQEVEVPRFPDSRHMKVVRLSALCAGHLYPSGSALGTHFCLSLSRHQGHSVTRRFMSMKNSNDTIGNWTRDLPAYNVLPQSASTCTTREHVVLAGILVKCWLEWESVHSVQYTPVPLFISPRNWTVVSLVRSQQLPCVLSAPTVLHYLCAKAKEKVLIRGCYKKHFFLGTLKYFLWCSRLVLNSLPLPFHSAWVWGPTTFLYNGYQGLFHEDKLTSGCCWLLTSIYCLS
jgi:hypothetical protein